MIRVPRAKVWLMALLLLLPVASTGAQEGEGIFTRNPLDEIRDELIKVLENASLPFTAEQEKAIAFVLEESRRASEQMFGDIMDFRNGPPQGEDRDRALAGIAWMNEDFSKRVRGYLTPEQLAVWDKYVESRAAARKESKKTAGTSEQVQQIRVNRNPFTAESQYRGYPFSGGSYGYSNGSGVQAEIINRGGTGAWHGNFQFQLKDESLDARNPFASNKPSYQQRNINLNASGPLLRNRLTIGGNFNQSMQDNAATINALTLEGPVQIGFTQPQVFRYGGFDGVYQITQKQSLHFFYYRQRFNVGKQGMGGFSLPEREIDYTGGDDYFKLRHVWFASPRLVQDISFSRDSYFQVSTPVTEGSSIDVLGAFNGGSAQNRARSNDADISVSSLWIYTRKRWTIRAGGGFQGYSTNERSESNFQGTFTFSDLDSYRQGVPILYTEIRGDPLLVNSQREWSFFFQNEFEATKRITLFFGLRYERQNDLDDDNNFDPRAAAALAIDKSTVIRAGIGVFRMRIGSFIENTLARMDGNREVEIVIDNPSYPDPFQSGDIRIVPPSSRRVAAEDLAAPYSVNASFQIERSLPKNLFVTASYDYHKGSHILRSRNLNAPRPGETERPDPSEGNVWRLESTGISKFKAIRVAMRQRFSIFSLDASYSRELNGDIITNFGAPTDNFNLNVDYAEYVRHYMNMSINSRLFWNVFLTTNISFSNGSPYTITTGYDDNGDGVTNDRPKGVPRYSGRGPRQSNVSFNLSKAFTLGGIKIGGASPNVNLFANFNNAFNRTNLGTPVGVLSSPFLGKSISAYNPRQITVGMRFQF
jgi:hypothetical protein